MRKIDIEIGYQFKNVKLLETAFVHRSYSHEKQNKIENNERLEFLGDAVLELTISEYLFKNFPELPEGEMTKVRASVVCEKTLVKVATKHNFSNFLLVSRSEHIGNNGKRRPSMLADCVEAVIGAIYLDGGYIESQKFILNNLAEYVAESIKGLGVKDYKTTLQEIIQRDPTRKLEYVLIRAEGPEHDKTFYMKALCDNVQIGNGIGKTKKEAEQMAAKMAIERMKYEA
ncbi:MAG: ribonuclease III [Clostridiales bacterium]|nr:ribonuclease III [Clostridiales bacterium]